MSAKQPVKDYKHYVFKASKHLIEALKAVDEEDYTQLKRHLTMAAGAAQEAKFRLRKHLRRIMEESKRDNNDDKREPIGSHDAASDSDQDGLNSSAA